MSAPTGEELLEVEVDDDVEAGPRQVVVQVPAIDEDPERFRAVLDGITNQEVVGHGLTAQAWVTPVDEADETLAVARDHPAVAAIEAPPGKLSTRNAAHTRAFDEGADVVVSWDADAAPAHKRVLAALLDPFEHPDVVASHGAPRAPWNNPVNVAINAASYLEDRVRPHVNSQLSALTAYAWDEAGPFDESVDQRDVHAVRRHEEFEFHRALEQLGEVARVPEAAVLEEPRRPMHHLNRAMDRASLGRYPLGEWGEGRGAVTFQVEED